MHRPSAAAPLVRRTLRGCYLPGAQPHLPGRCAWLPGYCHDRACHRSGHRSTRSRCAHARPNRPRSGISHVRALPRAVASLGDGTTCRGAHRALECRALVLQYTGCATRVASVRRICYCSPTSVSLIRVKSQSVGTIHYQRRRLERLTAALPIGSSLSPLSRTFAVSTATAGVKLP